MDIKPNKQTKKYRPTQFPKVTQEVLDRIVQDIREGSTKKHAPEANGISERHFYYLIAQGILDIEYNKHDTMCAKLVQSLRKVEQEEIKGCRVDIRTSGDGHKGAQWTLEHAYWRHFGKDAGAKEIAEELGRLRTDMMGAKHGSGEEKEDPKE